MSNCVKSGTIRLNTPHVLDYAGWEVLFGVKPIRHLLTMSPHIHRYVYGIPRTLLIYWWVFDPVHILASPCVLIYRAWSWIWVHCILGISGVHISKWKEGVTPRESSIKICTISSHVCWVSRPSPDLAVSVVVNIASIWWTHGFVISPSFETSIPISMFGDINMVSIILKNNFWPFYRKTTIRVLRPIIQRPIVTEIAQPP